MDYAAAHSRWRVSTDEEDVLTGTLRKPADRSSLGGFDSALNRHVVSGLIALAWILFSIVAFIDLDATLSWTAAFLFFLFSYASFLLWRTVLAKRVAPLELMFWLYNTNFLLLPALSQSLHRTFYWSAYESYSEASLIFTCLIIASDSYSLVRNNACPTTIAAHRSPNGTQTTSSLDPYFQHGRLIYSLDPFYRL